MNLEICRPFRMESLPSRISTLGARGPNNQVSCSKLEVLIPKSVWLELISSDITRSDLNRVPLPQRLCKYFQQPSQQFSSRKTLLHPSLQKSELTPKKSKILTKKSSSTGKFAVKIPGREKGCRLDRKTGENKFRIPEFSSSLGHR